MENIVFLDIDGVMNDYEGNPEEFSPEAVKIINYLYNKYNISIVISSGWRDSYTFDDFEKLFEKNGVLARVIDITPIFLGDLQKKNASIRDEEIFYYVRRHNLKKYLILDDYSIRYKELVPHFVQTDYDKGLSFDELQKIEKILT